MLRPFSALLALSILLGAPGLPAYQASAAVIAARPLPAGPAAVAWRGAVTDLLRHDAARPMADMTPRLRSVLGQLRFSLDSGASNAALAFVSYIPAGSPADPAAFAKLIPAHRAAVLDAATLHAFQALQPRARELLYRAEGGALSDADRRELRELEAVWFYLDPDTGREVRSLARAERERGALRLGEGIARALGRPAPDAGRLESDAAASKELEAVLAGAARLVAEDSGRLARPGPGAPNAGLTRDVLAPYLANALDHAAARQVERGQRAESVYELVLSAHHAVFGGKLAKPLLRALRPAGEWTEFVAAASLHAATRLAGAQDATPLRKAAGDGNLLLPIPAWHGAAGQGAATVAALIAARHGVAEPEFPAKGRLFTAFGIPVRADMGFYLFAALASVQLGSSFFAGASSPLLLGAAAVALIYATLLGHEFAHALTARAFGVKTHGINLNFLGGAAHIEREPRRPLAEFLIAGAGPAFNFAYAAVVMPLALLLDPSPVKAVLLFSGWANILLGAFNLVPAYPMDGGRLLRSGLAALLRDHYKATHAAAWVGLLIGGAVALWSWQQFAFTGNWGMLLNIVLGLFVVMGSRAAMLHPGTTLLEPDGKLRR